ncbi:hypothetical protein OC842_006666 [Tilletia horrida]|uniref:HhH-GPD domain-containing protein n=1 Tax=Tilletia horrida TaxID=155126 RepID=A0AAN6G5G0_9BASI|nr:hypothetical protein OC842_006666 [Tilletia horrida]
MVSTRAGTLAAGAAGKAAAVRSFSQAFPAVKASSAPVANGESNKNKARSSSTRTSVKVEAAPSTTVAAASQSVVRRGRGRPAAALKEKEKEKETVKEDDDDQVAASPRKRTKVATASLSSSSFSAKAKAKAKAEEPTEPVVMLPDDEARLCTTIERPHLTFSVDAALEHLCAYDVRFARLRHKVGLRTFTSPAAASKPLNLFQTLVTSIMGQQVSWLAARAILYKFTRIWAPELPEKPDWDTLARDQLPFPTPRQVYETSEARLREAGLSFAKIRYVKGLAERFGSGQMDVRVLMAEQDEQALVKKLCEIKGVGVWTAQMCMIFALRRPDVLSHGDLGIQKGMVIWHLAGPEGPTVRAETRKPDGRPGEADDAAPKSASGSGPDVNEALAEASTQTRVDAVVSGDAPVDTAIVSGATQPPPPAPSGEAADDPRSVPPLPADSGLTMRILEERRKGKKIKGMYLTPAEMDSLAKAWHPYESIASLFMWSLID